MSKPLVFMMGVAPVFVPVDRRYARNHMWAVEAGDGFRIGFSAYAVRLMGDVNHLEWAFTTGQDIDEGRRIGYVDASKATSDLYAPATGRIIESNRDILATPGTINSNPYDPAWLFSMNAVEGTLLSPEEYVSYLEECWPLAQRLLKGQQDRAESR
jgi:glycine cleavage system H protein